MKRYGMTIGLDPAQAAEYRRLHSAVWPDVLKMLELCHIRNYSIFLREPENLMFAYFEYHGTDFAADIVTLHAPVPLHAPPQPVNVEPVAAAGVSVTIAPESKLNVHVAPHEMPAGADVIVPVPLPPFVIVSAYFLRLNVAVIAAALSVVMPHGPVPEQPPFVQPANTDSSAGVAVSVTLWPGPYCSLQSPGQLMPAGVDATSPMPLPAIVTTIELASANDGASEMSSPTVTTSEQGSLSSISWMHWSTLF